LVLNIQKLLAQDPNKAVLKAITAGVRLAFMAGDLRKFANHVKARTIEELKEYCYYKRFFNGGFAAGPEYNQASISGDTVHWSNGGIRKFHSDVMGLQHATGNSGTDLITGKAIGRMHELGLAGLSGDNFANEWHCEHTYPIKQIEKDLIREVIENSRRVSPKDMARYAMNHALATTVHTSERTHGGPTTNENLRPFEKYNDGVLQYVDGRFIDVTNATIQEVTYNRWNRNSYYKEFICLFEDLPDSNFEDVREETKQSLYNITPGSTERKLIDLTPEALDVLAQNDPMEIATRWCPDAFKDRWKKKK
jgi:hypothetical protein